MPKPKRVPMTQVPKSIQAAFLRDEIVEKVEQIHDLMQFQEDLTFDEDDINKAHDLVDNVAALVQKLAELAGAD